MNLRKIVSLLVLLAGLTGACFAQTALTQTTLSAAQYGPVYYSGTTNQTSQTVTLAACTGVIAPVLPGTPASVIYIDGEAEGVFTWNSSTCSGSVLRGYLGTQQSPHVSGTMVLIAPAYQTTLLQGANPTPSGLFNQDPPFNGACTAAGTPTTPWVNVLTSAQWLCSTVTGTWVPGFNNPRIAGSDVVTAAVASVAGSTLPSGPLFHVTGTNAITGWTTPVGCNATAVGGCQFTIIPDAVCTWTSAGNISLAGTCAVGKAVTFIWDAKNSKWIPSIIA